jgi:uncharacterized membrane protein (UPF0182 family)
MSGRRGLWLSLVAVALTLLAGRALAGTVADYRWYAAVGAVDVWSLQFVSSLILRLLAFVVGTAVAFVNLWGVRHSVVSLVLPRRLGNIEIGEEVPGRTLMTVVLTMSVMLGGAFAALASDWKGFELAFRGVAFNQNVPYYNVDVGFFVFWLPFERAAYAWCVCVVAMVAVLVVALYALTPSLRVNQGKLHVSTYVRRHIGVLGGLAIALIAWSFRLEAFEAATHGSGADGAFSAFDHELRAPIATVLAYVGIGCAFVVAWAAWTGQTRIAFAVITVLLLLAPTLQYGLPLAIRWGSAPVDPAVRERAYAADRAGFTRTAFGLHRIRTFDTRDAFASSRDAAVASVWDPRPLARAIERTRRRGGVIESVSLAASPEGPVFVSVEQPASGDQRGSWTLIRTFAATTDERGAMIRVDDAGRFPLEDQTVGPVYVHDGAQGSLIVSGETRPPAAPSIGSFGARLAEALSQQDMRLLRTPPEGARIMRRRDVRERVRAILPFFSQGTRVIPIAHGDSLLWALELYSTTVDYPLARSFGALDGEVNYLRHAATALVHAYTGRVTVIPDEEPDPIAQSWIRLLPGTLGRSQLVPSLAALLPPEVDGALVQAEAFAAVGLRREEGARRQVPMVDGSDTMEEGGDTTASRSPTFVWLPSGVSAWTAPLLNSRDRLSGVLVATGGARRQLRWFASRDTTINWQSLLERLRRVGEDEEVPPGTLRVRGRIRVLPLADSMLLAVQPFFGWPSDGPPFVSRIAVAHGDSTRGGPSLAAVLGAPSAKSPIPATPDARHERMRTLYAEMRAALQRGDFRAFGVAFEELGLLLQRR